MKMDDCGVCMFVCILFYTYHRLKRLVTETFIESFYTIFRTR